MVKNIPAALLMALLACMSAFAGTLPSCPAVYDASGCNLFIVINPDSSITTTAGDPTPYDGNDDIIVGILNNSASVVSSLNISGWGADGGIFEFDGDGICEYNFVGDGYCSSLPPGSSGYEGPMNTYSNISTMVVTDDTGTVNFTGGLEPNQQTYFGLENSLEELTAGGGITITQGNSPEPSTLVLFATGLAGVWAIGRRKRA